MDKNIFIKNIKFSVEYALKNYVNFEGRTARAEYWYWVLAIFAAEVVLSVLTSIIPFLHILVLIFALGTLLPSVSISVRRFHDIDKPGWMVAMGLIPVVGFIGILYFAYQKGSEGPNQYGPAPVSIGPR